MGILGGILEFVVDSIFGSENGPGKKHYSDDPKEREREKEEERWERKQREHDPSNKGY